MTPEQRLEDLEAWLLSEYNATLDIWAHSESPTMKAIWYARMQTLQAVARHLITSRDDLVPVFNERFMPFTQHVKL
jgi:hypothetical protein